jgi:ribonuclease HI
MAAGIFKLYRHTIIMVVELEAIRQGLLLAWDFGYRQVVMQSDSLEAVHAISIGVLRSHPSLYIISDISHPCLRNWSVSFEHTLREVNRGVDFLAKLGSSGDMCLSRFFQFLLKA